MLTWIGCSTVSKDRKYKTSRCGICTQSLPRAETNNHIPSCGRCYALSSNGLCDPPFDTASGIDHSFASSFPSSQPKLSFPPAPLWMTTFNKLGP